MDCSTFFWMFWNNVWVLLVHGRNSWWCTADSCPECSQKAQRIAWQRLHGLVYFLIWEISTQVHILLSDVLWFAFVTNTVLSVNVISHRGKEPCKPPELELDNQRHRKTLNPICKTQENHQAGFRQGATVSAAEFRWWEHVWEALTGIFPQSTRGWSQLRVGTKDNPKPDRQENPLLEGIQCTIPNLHGTWTSLLGSRSKPAARVELHIARCQEGYGCMTQPIPEISASRPQSHGCTGSPACEIGSQMSGWKRALSTAGSTVARTTAQRQQLSDCCAQRAARTNHTCMLLPRDRQLTHGQRHSELDYKNPSQQVIKTN